MAQEYSIGVCAQSTEPASFQFPHNRHPNLCDLTSRHIRFTFKAFSACFFMALEVDSGIPVALAMSTMHLLHSYLLIRSYFSSRVIDFLSFLPLVALFVSASTFVILKLWTA
jgi:hypothetical protein